ncbi:hypothetical protein JNB11_04385 [Kocuria palustris]|nr:hypothetical protein [Kocuria palustris]
MAFHFQPSCKMINTASSPTPPVTPVMAAVDNYYDICMNSKSRTAKLLANPLVPKRAPSVTNSRPLDYYVKKLSNCLLSDELVQSLSGGTRFLLTLNDLLSGDDHDDDSVDEVAQAPPVKMPPLPNPSPAPVLLQHTPLLKRHTLMPQLRRSQASQAAFNVNPSLTSLPGLTRTKTRYILTRETKERRVYRKKKYDESDCDDVILDDNQLFNVPVLRSYGDLYKHTHDFCDNLDGDNKYPVPIKPCPLPGRLESDTTEVSPNLLMVLGLLYPGQGTPLTNISEDGTDILIDDDVTIVRNISQFYSERLASLLKLVKLQRDQHTMYKLPQYVRLQSLMDELHFISPEKLEMLDQLRPINLPPKLNTDKSKHLRQFNKVLTNFESQNTLTAQSAHEVRINLLQSQQKWLRIIAGLRSGSSLGYHRKFDQQKNEIRKLAWDANPPVAVRYQFWIDTMLVSSKVVEGIAHQYNAAQAKYLCLDAGAKAQKDAEFDRIITHTLDRPLFTLIMKEKPEFSDFRANYRFLLYIKYFSEHGLHKRDEIFMIPILLLMFEHDHSMEEIFTLLELFNTQVFTLELLLFLNRDFSNWGDASTLPHSYTKGLAKFGDMLEFEGLNSASFFEILCQINDSLPLLMLAPSTPIVGTHFNWSLLLVDHPNPESEDCDSASLQLMVKLLTTLIIYAHLPKLKTKNNLKVMQTFLVIVFTYYHINWNNFKELISENASIRLNNTLDKVQVMELFADKWRQLFRK